MNAQHSGTHTSARSHPSVHVSGEVSQQRRCFGAFFRSTHIVRGTTASPVRISCHRAQCSLDLVIQANRVVSSSHGKCVWVSVWVERRGGAGKLCFFTLLVIGRAGSVCTFGWYEQPVSQWDGDVLSISGENRRQHRSRLNFDHESFVINFRSRNLYWAEDSSAKVQMSNNMTILIWDSSKATISVADDDCWLKKQSLNPMLV